MEGGGRERGRGPVSPRERSCTEPPAHSVLMQLPPSLLRTDLANLVVFYKDLNERLIMENPANTVSSSQAPTRSLCLLLPLLAG